MKYTFLSMVIGAVISWLIVILLINLVIGADLGALYIAWIAWPILTVLIGKLIEKHYLGRK